MAYLDEIAAALEAKEYQKALDIATGSTSTPDPNLLDLIHQRRFSDLSPTSYTPALIKETLGSIADDRWVSQACIAVVTSDEAAVRAAVELGLARTTPAKEEADKWLENQVAVKEDGQDMEVDGEVKNKVEGSLPTLESYFSANPMQKALCDAYITLSQRLALLDTFSKLPRSSPESISNGVDVASTPLTEDPWAESEDMEVELDDPWAEAEKEEESKETSGPPGQTSSGKAIPLVDFLSQSIQSSAIYLAASGSVEELLVLEQRHQSELWPYRFQIIEAIPPWNLPSSFESLLPSITPEGEFENEPPSSSSPTATTPTLGINRKETVDGAQYTPLAAAALQSWYEGRILAVDAGCGAIDVELAWVQHGITKGIIQLDKVGEELSLLSKLVYEAGNDEVGMTQDWTLTKWRSSTELEIVQAYLSGSTPSTLAADIKRLLSPYLYMLQARAERDGRGSENLVKRYLHEYILTAPLEMSLAVFEASKATISTNDRIVKNDLEVARLALARLYGSDSLYEWDTMSRIFECLPVWDLPDDREIQDDQEITMTTLQSLGAYVTPSTSQPTPPGPVELELFFEPLPFASLSRALDILDVHLESGEILARWGVPAPLRWFLQSAFDKGEQRSWAVRMARMAVDQVERTSARVGVDQQWISLREDMVKLSGGGEGLLRGAFGLLSQEEVFKIFLGGVLSSGKFELAKTLLRKTEFASALSAETIEELVLSVSREFYDNAASGNMHSGEMKQAYDCLSVAKDSPAIRSEKGFIEATSRISSFQVKTIHGDPISPLEIRMTKNRLDLVAKVLSSSSDSYKHVDMMLDLANKLGLKGDQSAEIRVLAMLAESAMLVPDFEQAGEICGKMVGVTEVLRKKTRIQGHGRSLSNFTTGTGKSNSLSLTPEEEKIAGAIEVCWKTCSQLGRQTEFTDLPRRLILLGRALEFCPPETIPELLVVWRRVEDAQIQVDEAARRKADPLRTSKGTVDYNNNRHQRNTSIGGSTENSGLMGTGRTAARVTKTLNSLAHDLSSNFRGVGGVGVTGTPTGGAGTNRSSRLSNSNHSPAASDRSSRLRESLSELGETARDRDVEIRQQARRALVKGVGWLIGAGEDELTGGVGDGR